MSYTIGQVAKKLGISTYTLRYYDKEGLIPNVKRMKNGVRIFEESDLHFLQVIFCLKKTGMAIEAVSYTHLDVYKRQGSGPDR